MSGFHKTDKEPRTNDSVDEDLIRKLWSLFYLSPQDEIKLCLDNYFKYKEWQK